ncbi:hypothetical protein COHA_010434 [Chlorella ohadii]|uniref:Uncharacterized protein n=1 Tax=Chlorella ohadii TaxID=2649997 RepID=A0AAD5DHU1_9CHLO|nr:hypothetical protein COHA_010434 [Chlorella ohadii]
MLPLCCVYGVPPAAVALGASYFQRLLAGSEPLRNTALQFGYFSFVGDEAVMHAQPGCPDLLTILLLSHVLGSPVPTEKAIDLEMRCLKNLRWRLGPYCCAAPART